MCHKVSFGNHMTENDDLRAYGDEKDFSVHLGLVSREGSLWFNRYCPRFWGKNLWQN